MSSLAKFALIPVAGVVAAKVLSSLVAGGTAGHCISREDSGQFREYTNSCSYPINTVVCSQYIIGSRSCRSGMAQPGAHISTTGSDQAGVLVGILSPVQLAIAACKVGHQPQFEGGESTQYNCVRDE